MWPQSAGPLDACTPWRGTSVQDRASHSAAAAGGAAALADVAAPRRAHLGAAREAQRRVGGLPLYQLQQLGRRTDPAADVLLAGRRLVRLLLDLVLDRRRGGHGGQLRRRVARRGGLRPGAQLSGPPPGGADGQLPAALR